MTNISRMAPATGGITQLCGGGPADHFRRVERPVRHLRSVSVDRPRYAVRRTGAIVLLVAAMATAGVLLDGLLASFGGDPASAAEALPAVTGADAGPIRHVASAGDSLWTIADRYRGEVGRADYVDALIHLNGGTKIYVGQAVLLP